MQTLYIITGYSFSEVNAIINSIILKRLSLNINNTDVNETTRGKEERKDGVGGVVILKFLII